MPPWASTGETTGPPSNTNNAIDRMRIGSLWFFIVANPPSYFTQDMGYSAQVKTSYHEAPNQLPFLFFIKIIIIKQNTIYFIFVITIRL